MTEDFHKEEQIRERVIQVAMAAFYSKGVKSVTMDEIAHELTMSKRTLYQLFSDKETLLLACIEAGKKAHVQLLEERLKHTDNVLEMVLYDFSLRLNTLKSINPLFLEEISRFPKIVERLKQERHRHKEKAVAFLQKGVSQGLFREDINFEIIYTLLMDHVDGVHSVERFSRYSPTDVFKHLVFFYLRGCTTPKGIEMMDNFLAKQL